MAACKAVFIKLKREIACLVVLTCDASTVGVAGILSHIIDGQE
jgi:hypothetical protein